MFFTVDSAKQFLRPEDLDSLDLIGSRYAPMRQSLLSLYQALDFQPFRRSEPSLQALEYVSNLAKLRRRVTAKEQRVGKVKMKAPLGHLTQRWRKHALEGDKITPITPLAATDADNDTLVYTASPLPNGITVDSKTGTLSGTLTHQAVHGVAVFDNLSVSQVGTGYLLQAAGSGGRRFIDFLVGE